MHPTDGKENTFNFTLKSFVLLDLSNVNPASTHRRVTNNTPLKSAERVMLSFLILKELKKIYMYLPVTVRVIFLLMRDPLRLT